MIYKGLISFAVRTGLGGVRFTELIISVLNGANGELYNKSYKK